MPGRERESVCFLSGPAPIPHISGLGQSRRDYLLPEPDLRVAPPERLLRVFPPPELERLPPDGLPPPAPCRPALPPDCAGPLEARAPLLFALAEAGSDLPIRSLLPVPPDLAVRFAGLAFCSFS